MNNTQLLDLIEQCFNLDNEITALEPKTLQLLQKMYNIALTQANKNTPIQNDKLVAAVTIIYNQLIEKKAKTPITVIQQKPPLRQEKSEQQQIAQPPVIQQPSVIPQKTEIQQEPLTSTKISNKQVSSVSSQKLEIYEDFIFETSQKLNINYIVDLEDLLQILLSSELCNSAINIFSQKVVNYEHLYKLLKLENVYTIQNFKQQFRNYRKKVQTAKIAQNEQEERQKIDIVADQNKQQVAISQQSQNSVEVVEDSQPTFNDDQSVAVQITNINKRQPTIQNKIQEEKHVEDVTISQHQRDNLQQLKVQRNDVAQQQINKQANELKEEQTVNVINSLILSPTVQQEQEQDPFLNSVKLDSNNFEILSQVILETEQQNEEQLKLQHKKEHIKQMKEHNQSPQKNQQIQVTQQKSTPRKYFSKEEQNKKPVMSAYAQNRLTTENQHQNNKKATQRRPTSEDQQSTKQTESHKQYSTLMEDSLDDKVLLAVEINKKNQQLDFNRYIPNSYQFDSVYNQNNQHGNQSNLQKQQVNQQQQQTLNQSQQDSELTQELEQLIISKQQRASKIPKLDDANEF